MFYSDAHLHLVDTAVFEKAKAAGVTAFAVNATQESEWKPVWDLSCAVSGVVPCFGVHPWYVSTITTGWDERLTGLLFRVPTACVGEIGLDKTRPDYEKQLAVFRHGLEIAAALNRPAQVHCVKAWDDMIPLLREFKNVPCLLHRFNGSAEIARQLSDLPVYFSVSDDKRMAFLPKDKVLLESDAPDGSLQPADIPALAERVGLNKEQLTHTFQLFFRL